MTSFDGRSASPFRGARALPDVPVVWRAILDARLADPEREQRRADERTAWADDLQRALRTVERAVGYRAEFTHDDPLDPRAALVELAAVACAWVDAMDLADAITRHPAGRQP